MTAKTINSWRIYTIFDSSMQVCSIQSSGVACCGLCVWSTASYKQSHDECSRQKPLKL